MKHLCTIQAFFVLLTALFLTSCGQEREDSVEDRMERQFSLLLRSTESNFSDQKKAGDFFYFPRSINETGDIMYVPSRDWCSGFFPGSLWLMYELFEDESWKSAAVKYTLLLEKEQWNGSTHDMGFKIMCSYGNALRSTGDSSYVDVITQSAQTLLSRFNPVVGAIRSWDHNSDRWSFPVIIDNMMNLELLFEAALLSNDSLFYQVAVAHANTTIRAHFREDYSSYHVVDFDPETGIVNERVTHQGAADSSAWARGQAWGLYGYTMCYRYTKDSAYLQQAIKIADFIFTHPNLPEDKIPLWDFNYDIESGEPRDVSAAAIVASALFELAEYAELRENEFTQLGEEILRNLEVAYSSAEGESKGFLLDHSVGHKPKDGEVDVPIIYADYYYLEALLRQKDRKYNVVNQ